MFDIAPYFTDLIWVFFIGFMLFGQAFQMQIWLLEIKGYLKKLETTVVKEKAEMTKFFKDRGASPEQITKLDRMLDYAVIMPTSLDPAGVVGKMEHIMQTIDDRSRAEITGILGPSASSLDVSIGENLVEIERGLNYIYKIVRHFYLSAKRSKSLPLVFSLKAVLGDIEKMITAYEKAMGSIALGAPIGDGLGPLVASKLIGNAPREEVAKDTSMGLVNYKGRQLYVIKAKGPTAYVGKPQLGLSKVLNEHSVDIVISVDAALKLEGEKTGEIAEGVGIAIGGLGMEKFMMEEITAEKNIPSYAILVKQDLEEAITTMPKAVAEAADKVVAIIDRIITTNVKEGGSAVVLGIGNTLGVV